MNRLKYPQKFTLVSMLFLLPMGTLLHTILSDNATQVEFGQNELRGTRYVRPLRQLLPLFSRARALSGSSAKGDMTARSKLVRIQSSIDEELSELAAIEREYDNALGTRASLDVLRRNWAGLRDGKRPATLEDSDAMYSEVIIDVRNLLSKVGDGSKLILDPDLGSYYLIDTVLIKLPEGIELLDRAGRVRESDVDPRLTTDTRASMSAMLRAISQKTSRWALIAQKSCPSRDLKRALQAPLREYLSAIETVRDQLDDDGEAPGDSAVDPRSIETAVELGGDLWDAVVVEIDALVGARIKEDVRTEQALMAWVGASLLLVSYVWVGFYRAVMKTVSALGDASSRLVGGDMTVGSVLETRDELGAVVRSFNDMASRLRLECEQATEESARAREAEARLRATEARSRLILDSSMDAVAVLDEQGTVIEWNPQAEVTFGWSREEAIGQSLADIAFPDATRDLFQSVLKSTALDLEDHVPGVRSELAMRRSDGREVPIELSITPVNSDGHPAVSVFFRDLSDRQRADEETLRAEEEALKAEALRVNKEAAEAASRAKSEFLANMSHEIRTPMNGIIGMTELALDTDLRPNQREYLGMVKISADALLTVINDILDFSKIEAGKVELDPTEFDLHDVLGDTLKPLSVRSHAKGLELACRIDPSLPQFVWGDHHRLQQVLINLVGNAIKFTTVGEVVVSAEPEPGDDSAIRFSVRDSGIGIPAARRDAIFEAFEQADGSTTRRYGGTGLGLSISQRLVELMGGRLWVESDFGSGSIFYFTARLPECDGETIKRADVPPSVSLAGLRALIVDDNQTNRLILEELTRGWGMDCESVDGGPDALIALSLEAETGPFQIVLLDWMMPTMNGVEVAREIVKQSRGERPKIVLLSSGGAPCDPDQMREAGIDACLIKPVKRSELTHAMQRVLGGSPDSRESPQAPLPVPACRGLKILLAEDNPVNQALAAQLLRKRSHEVRVVGDGREALDAIAASPFDLVLMDVQMPELDGYGAIAAIREAERSGSAPRLPVIAVTAFAMKGDRERCLEAGFDGYVSKPIQSETLFRTITEVLGKGRAEPPLPEPARAEPPPPTSDLAVIDWERFQLTVDGDRELASRMIELFLEDCRGLEAEVDAAVAEGDALRLRAASHALKGSASNFAADSVVHLSDTLEQIGSEGDLTEANAALSPLTEALEALREALASPPPQVADAPKAEVTSKLMPTTGTADS